MKYHNIAASFKIDSTLRDLQKEIENKIADKASMFPSFKLIRMEGFQYDGTDFRDNKLTFRLFFKQENEN